MLFFAFAGQWVRRLFRRLGCLAALLSTTWFDTGVMTAGGRPWPVAMCSGCRPPHCPELHPAEKLWDQLKDIVCKRVFKTIEDLRRGVLSKLQEFRENPPGAELPHPQQLTVAENK